MNLRNFVVSSSSSRRSNGSSSSSSSPSPSSSSSSSRGNTKKRSSSSSSTSSFLSAHKLKPWSEQYAPQRESDLAVHKKKVIEVKEWLQSAFDSLGQTSQSSPSSSSSRSMMPPPGASRHQMPIPCQNKILILTGPAGIGKSAVLRVLSNVMPFYYSEWLESAEVSWKDAEDRRPGEYTSRLEEFRQFIVRAERYGPLNFLSNTSSSSPSYGSLDFTSPSSSSSSFSSSRKVIVVEELPFLFGKAQTELFHKIIQDFLVSSPKFPLVFVMSDTYLGESSLYKVFSKKLLESPGVKQISFNPIPVGVMTRTLTCIAANEKFALTTEVVNSIADSSGGDIRSAINTLQFHCLNLNKVALSSTVAKKKRTSSSSTTKKPPSFPHLSSKKFGSDDSEDWGEAVALSGSRDVSFSIFHALGKMLYNKREGVPVSDGGTGGKKKAGSTRGKEEDGEEEYSEEEEGGGGGGAVVGSNTLDRRKLSFVPEEVLDNVSVDPSLFNTFLHENYLNFYSDIDDIHDALSYLSVADVLSSQWSDYSEMRQYVSSIASRGILFSNTHPQPRRWQPLFKPEYLKTMRTQEDNSRTIDELFIPTPNRSLLDTAQTPLEYNAMSVPSMILRTEILPYLGLIDKHRRFIRKGSDCVRLTTSQRDFLRSTNTYTFGYKSIRSQKIDKDSSEFVRTDPSDTLGEVVVEEEEEVEETDTLAFNRRLREKNRVEQAENALSVSDHGLEEDDVVDDW